MLVSLDFGPRILRIGFVGGPNILAEGSSLVPHGFGTRTEHTDRTLQRDDQPVEYEVDARYKWHSFQAPVDSFGLRKKLLVRSDKRGQFQVDHRISNLSSDSIYLCSCVVTEMAHGGTAYFPMPEPKADVERPWQNEPRSISSSSNPDGPRIDISRSLASIHPMSGLDPIKIESFVTQEWVAYANLGGVLFRAFSSDDWGFPVTRPPINLEVSTDDLGLALTTLGPAIRLEAGHEIVHSEGWKLHRRVAVPSNLEVAASLLSEMAKELTRTPSWLVWKPQS